MSNCNDCRRCQDHQAMMLNPNYVCPYVVEKCTHCTSHTSMMLNPDYVCPGTCDIAMDIKSSSL